MDKITKSKWSTYCITQALHLKLDCADLCLKTFYFLKYWLNKIQHIKALLIYIPPTEMFRLIWPCPTMLLLTHFPCSYMGWFVNLTHTFSPHCMAQLFFCICLHHTVNCYNRKKEQISLTSTQYTSFIITDMATLLTLFDLIEKHQYNWNESRLVPVKHTQPNISNITNQNPLNSHGYVLVFAYLRFVMFCQRRFLSIQIS